MYMTPYEWIGTVSTVSRTWWFKDLDGLYLIILIARVRRNLSLDVIFILPTMKVKETDWKRK
jgi:hypothetical protein